MVLNFEKATMSCRDGSKANDCKAVRSMLVDKWAMITGLEKEGPLHFPGTQISVSHVAALLHCFLHFPLAHYLPCGFTVSVWHLVFEFPEDRHPVLHICLSQLLWPNKGPQNYLQGKTLM